MVGIKSGSRIERNRSEGFQQRKELAFVCLFVSLEVWKLSNKSIRFKSIHHNTNTSTSIRGKVLDVNYVEHKGPAEIFLLSSLARKCAAEIGSVDWIMKDKHQRPY